MLRILWAAADVVEPKKNTGRQSQVHGSADLTSVSRKRVDEVFDTLE